MTKVEEQKEQVKLCPFIDAPCMGDDCALMVGMQQELLGVRRVVGICSLPALVMLMSNKPAAPAQRVNLGNLRI